MQSRTSISRPRMGRSLIIAAGVAIVAVTTVALTLCPALSLR